MNEYSQIPYYLVYTFALVVSLVVLGLSWKNKDGKGVKAFFISILLETTWLIGYMFELATNSLEGKLFWDNFQFIGALFAPIAIVIFSLQFTNRKFNLGRWVTIFVTISVILQFIIFADLWPELIHINPVVEKGVPFDELTYGFGSIAWVANIYALLLAFIYTGVLVSGFFRKNAQRIQLAIVTLGTTIPTAGAFAGIAFGWSFANQRDISPLMFAISNTIIAVGMFRFRLFNVVPVAREILFNSMSNLLIILDQNDRVIDTNPAARIALGVLDQDELIGTHISLLQPELYQEFGKTREVHTEITTGEQTFDFSVTPLYNKRGNLTGRLINANDITDQKKVEEQLNEINAENRLRAMRLNAIADISQIISQIRDLKTLLPVITQQISRKFDFYHVGIFLFSEDGKFAELVAANSDGGKRMLDRKHRLEIGQVGVVGRVAQDGTPRVALDVGQDAVYFDNPDLPETHSEMALPLKVGAEIIGVLDVQSKRKNIFSKEDTEAFLSLANQVAIAIGNARQVEATQAALEEARSLTQEYVREAWTDLVRTQQAQLGYRYVNNAVFPIQKTDDAVLDESSEQNSYEYPVQLRGETIGIIKIRMTEDEALKMTANDEALLEAVGERAALALDSARLLDDAQRRAARERAIGEISASISSSTDMETILSSAVKELGERMGGAKVVLELGTAESSKKQENGHE